MKLDTSAFKDITRKQFNQQAGNFSKWSVTRNLEYMQAYFDFCHIKPEDKLLDVACGTGEFVLFCAPRINSATGVDISEGMIELAVQQAQAGNITNAEFICRDIAVLPCEDAAFSIVICKSAFHHISDLEPVLQEMIRCCQPGGRISVQDIVAYDSEPVDRYFEKLEKLIDISHHRTRSQQEIIDLYKQNGLTITAEYSLCVELNLREYVAHATQTEENHIKIERLLAKGLADQEISAYFLEKEGALFFKRNVFLILGTRQA
ncbi:MAG TPA: methyltransferase domain-containing protein [bacterium]|nr:methyltransferase domain-containing protein [bacterium]HPN45217.1 methyltransferase domain-containing protein [bacterium]